MYAPISRSGDYDDNGEETSDSVDKMIYYNGVFLTKDNPLGLTSTGVSITNTGYIAYDFQSLSGAIGGLAGKTIEIEFDEIPKGNDNGL